MMRSRFFNLFQMNKLNTIIVFFLIQAPNAVLAQPNYQRALESMQQGLPKEALVEINQAISTDRNNDNFLAYRAFILRHLDRNEEALSDIKTAIKLNNQEGWYFIEATLISHRIGYLNFAKKYVNRALEFGAVALGSDNYDYALKMHDELQDYDYELDLKFDPKNPDLEYESDGLLKIIVPSAGYPYQDSNYSITGATIAKKEKVYDTEYIFLKPTSNSISIKMKIRKKAYSYIPLFKNYKPNKKFTKSVSKYLGDSPRMNLQSQNLKSVANSLKGSNDLSTIHNTLNWVNQNMIKLDHVPTWNSIEDLLREKKIECGTGSFTVIALLRSNGIPARQVWGPIDNKIPVGFLKGHVWTEVFLNRIGWVPVEQFDSNTLGQLPISYIRMATHSDHLYENRPLSNMIKIMNHDKYGDIIPYKRNKIN
ncbi:transglutaminase domain-containing protein [Leptospira sp. GIMC2001]|uniref:transglutaminase domain-containing protein n=1 Tax=Leptospira sp. GIMC2001 TaxID=1513297 RepID=UPI0023496F9B|nr:transglutaminase domain-containing protein [Leptospira sp. GIMC2001]WCL49988.1 hypothetical protein O4O04_03990 [Leptospira sp. GIMC2001]